MKCLVGFKIFFFVCQECPAEVPSTVSLFFQIGSESISKFLGEAVLKELINFVLGYFSQLDVPVKRGTFVEYRTGAVVFF
jgi:hypothetical protein